MKFVKALTYDDVLLIPQYSDIKSRKEVSLESILGPGLDFSLPIVSSPMDTVTENEMAKAMAKAGGLGVIHRYNSIREQAELVSLAWGSLTDTGPNNIVAAAVGVTGDFEERATAVCDAGAKIVCIDVAHGHHSLVKEAIGRLKSVHGDKLHVMAGNVATADGFRALESWGADSIRIGIGNGSICSTRIKTGFGVPSLHMVLECAAVRKKAKIVSDGGIKNSGDIVKALAAGADFVMLGSLLAGTTETPCGLGMTLDGKKFKTYRGMASKEAQEEWKGSYSSDEGVSATIPFKGSVAGILHDLKKGIASGFSYAGARSLKELQEDALFIQQTASGFHESQTHIFSKA